MIPDLSNIHRREIIDILIGDSDVPFVEGYESKLPNLSGSVIESISQKFNLNADCSGSRWMKMTNILKAAIEINRHNEVLSHIISNVNCSRCEVGNDREILNNFIDAIIERINLLLIFNGIALQRTDGADVRVISTSSSLISLETEKILDIAYVRNLTVLCENDFFSGNIDSVITKVRTMVEEVMIHILEQEGPVKDYKGKLHEMFNDVKEILNMDSKVGPVQGIVKALSDLVWNIGGLRNNYSDGHAQGKSRVTLSVHEARLMMNSAVTLMEYVLSIYETQKSEKVIA